MVKKVSVIIPIYKGNIYVYNLISMLEDNWKIVNTEENVQIEMVLVNDFPTEKLEIKEEWIRNISWTVVINKKNQGIHFSRVQGLMHSSGDYILFLDQDDEISPIYIREQIVFLRNYDAIICNGKNYNNIIYRNSEELNKAIDKLEYKEGHNWIVSPGQVLLRRSAIPVEWINNIINKNGADDYFLWMLMFCKGRKIGINHKVLFLHVISETNTSNDQTEMNKSVFEVVSKMRILGYLKLEEEKKIKESRSALIKLDSVSIDTYLKEREYKRILDMWMTLRDQKITVDMFLLKKKLKRIVIYGAGMFGKHLYNELKETAVEVDCFLDQNKSANIPGASIFFPGERLENIDAIIITPFMEYENIKEKLSIFYPYAIVSLKTVLLNANCKLQEEDNIKYC